MMKLGIVTRKDEKEKWGGDLKAIYSIHEGLKEIGQDVLLGKTAEELENVDFVLLSNICCDLKEDFVAIQKMHKSFGVICFHEDRDQYYGPCYGFAHYVGLCLHQPEQLLEQLFENPEIVYYFSYQSPSFFQENFSILNQAKICIATSQTEKQTLQRDCPECPTEAIQLDCGISDHFLKQNDDLFLKWTGLKHKEYILQVARIQPRKNQLATILAMKDLDIPLVFIATETSIYSSYEKLCFQAIKKWRKAPTIIISQAHENRTDGNLQILKMPNGEILPFSMLVSAYQHAGLMVHPAFCELPGLVYLEAAKLGIPIIASEWTTVKDYFTDPITGRYSLDDRISYVLPHHVKILENMILSHFGKKVDKNFIHPIFQRQKSDVAKDLIQSIKKYIGS